MFIVVEKVVDVVVVVVNDVINVLVNIFIIGKIDDKFVNNNDVVFVSVVEGCCLYIGNFVYVIMEGELKEFFKGYFV